MFPDARAGERLELCDNAVELHAVCGEIDAGAILQLP
jgi:hypothetical protein